MQTGRGVGEDRSDAGTALDLAVYAFEAVGRAQGGALGKSKTVKPSGRFSSAHRVSLGASVFQASSA